MSTAEPPHVCPRWYHKYNSYGASQADYQMLSRLNIAVLSRSRNPDDHGDQPHFFHCRSGRQWCFGDKLLSIMDGEEIMTAISNGLKEAFGDHKPSEMISQWERVGGWSCEHNPRELLKKHGVVVRDQSSAPEATSRGTYLFHSQTGSEKGISELEPSVWDFEEGVHREMRDMTEDDFRSIPAGWQRVTNPTTEGQESGDGDADDDDKYYEFKIVEDADGDDTHQETEDADGDDTHQETEGAKGSRRERIRSHLPSFFS